MVKTTIIRRVRLSTSTVGSYFGTVGVVRDRRSGRRLATTDVYPYGFDGAAYDAAMRLALSRGWTPTAEVRS